MGALDSLLGNLGGGGGGTGGATGSYNNQVYLGVKKAKTVTAKRTGQTFTVPEGDKTVTLQEAQAMYLTDPAVKNKWLQTLRKNGMPTDEIRARQAWDLAVAGASDWYATSNGTAKVTPEQYLGFYVKSQGKSAAANVPTRSVYQYTPEQLGAKIDEVAQSLLGRAITDADKTAEWYQDLNNSLNKMVMKGTVSSTTKVKNPKTGKMENLALQKPEVTQEAITNKITSALTEADPESLKRKQDLDVEKWFLSMRGKG